MATSLLIKGENMQNKAVGTMGEQAATEFLKSKKYLILHVNYATPIGEIDIIAKQKNTIVFVEVKKRSSLVFGRASEAVNKHKQRKIRQVALYYLKNQKQLNENVRFDVIEVYDNGINHIENAF